MDMAAPLMASLPKELRDAGIRIPPSSQEIISGEMVNQPLNLFTHIFFMGFLSSIGMKVASVGVMLLRPIVVKVKEVPSKPLG